MEFKTLFKKLNQGQYGLTVFSPKIGNVHLMLIYQLVFKGATKLYFMHYLSVVFILLNTGLWKSAFSTYFFGKLVCFIFLHFLCFLPVLRRI